jgi:glycosyltransferase involved in cell wall biosynthesis
VKRSALLVLTSTYPRHAADHGPRFVHDLCRQLQQRFDVHVLAPHAPGSATRETLDGIEVHRFRYLPESFETLAYDGGIPARLSANPLLLFSVPLFCAALVLAALRLALQLRPAAVHAHWIVPQGLAGMLVSRLASGRPPLVCTAHGADLYTLEFAPFRRLKSLVLRRAAQVTVVSRAMRDDAIALGAMPDGVAVAPMGVDTEAIFHPDPRTARERDTVLFVGRLVAKKGVAHLLDALAQLAPRRPHLRLDIVGDGPERAVLERRARELGIEPRVVFHGAQPQQFAADRLRRAALAVFPFVPAAGGDREGFGLVVVEAQACACPVVAFDVPALRDTIEDGVSGLLAPCADATALARAMERVLDDAPLAARIGAAGARCAARFSWDEVGRGYRELFERLIA